MKKAVPKRKSIKSVLMEVGWFFVVFFSLQRGKHFSREKTIHIWNLYRSRLSSFSCPLPKYKYIWRRTLRKKIRDRLCIIFPNAGDSSHFPSFFLFSAKMKNIFRLFLFPPGRHLVLLIHKYFAEYISGIGDKTMKT